MKEDKHDFPEHMNREGSAGKSGCGSSGNVASVLAVILFAVCLFFDFRYLSKWLSYGMSDVKGGFVFLVIFHLIVYGIPFIVFRRQSHKAKCGGSGNDKGKKSLVSDVIILFVLTLIAAFGVVQINTMTEYIYKSRNGHYDKTHEEFLSGATLTVTSENMHDGKWDQIIGRDSGDNMSPQISFDPVEGADGYVIYMVDESSSSWVHWYARDIHATDIAAGENPGQYTGPYPCRNVYLESVSADGYVDPGNHTYTVYVFALKDSSAMDYEIDFDDVSYSPDYLYYDFLNVSDSSSDPYRYGNVLAYGYISGTYEDS